MLDFIPPAIGLPIAAILWMVLLIIWFKAPLMRKVNDFFAHRRHIRRMRKGHTTFAAEEEYLTRDIQVTMALFNTYPQTKTTATR